MPQWPWQAQPARKRSRTPSESEAGEALHFEDSDFYEHQSSAGPQQVQVTDESVNDNMVGGKGDGGQGDTNSGNQFVQNLLSRPEGSVSCIPADRNASVIVLTVAWSLKFQVAVFIQSTISFQFHGIVKQQSTHFPLEDKCEQQEPTPRPLCTLKRVRAVLISEPFTSRAHDCN